MHGTFLIWSGKSLEKVLKLSVDKVALELPDAVHLSVIHSWLHQSQS